MLKKSPWRLFVLVFALMIAGIQSLGWWTRPAPASVPASVPAQVSRSKQDPFASSAAMRHLHCQPKHWRMLVMQH